MREAAADSLWDSLQALPRDAWRRRWLVVSVSWLAALLGMGLLPLHPERHEARALVYLDEQSVLKPLMAGMAHQPDVDQQLRLLVRTVVSPERMQGLVDGPLLGMADASPRDKQAQVARMLTGISLSASDKGLYAIRYRDPLPERAERVVQATLDLFVSQSLAGTQRETRDASRFIAERIASYEARLRESEDRLKAFKLLNFGDSGLPGADHFARIAMLSDSVNRLGAELQAAERSRDAYRRALAAEPARMPGDAEFDAAGVPSPVSTSLSTARAQLGELTTRFTPEHPDIKRLQREVARLEALRASEAAERSAAARGGPATNPVVQQLRVSVTEGEARVSSLASRLASEQALLAQLRATGERRPAAEAELAQLTRDHDALRKTYEELVTRQESASLGEKLDETSRAGAFQVVEAPNVSPGPVFPSHLALAAIVVAVSLLAGLLAPLALQRLRPTIADAQTLRRLTGRPVLGSLSLWPHAHTLREARQERWRVGLAAASLLALQGAWLAWVASR